MIYPTPQGMTVEDTGGVMTMTRRWFNLTHVLTLVFCVFWNGFLVFWYSMLPDLFNEGQIDPFMLIFYLFPLIHVSVGVGLLYFSLAGFVNKTIIQVTWDQVEVKHTPLWWPGSRKVPSSNIQQFYTHEVISRSQNGVSATYRVSAVLKNHQKILFVSGLASKDEGLYIEKTLEERLRIRDEPVAGEVDRVREEF